MNVIILFIKVNYIMFFADLFCYLLHFQTLENRNKLTPSSPTTPIPRMTDLDHLVSYIFSILFYNLVAPSNFHLKTSAVVKWRSYVTDPIQNICFILYFICRKNIFQKLLIIITLITVWEELFIVVALPLLHECVHRHFL